MKGTRLLLGGAAVLGLGALGTWFAMSKSMPAQEAASGPSSWVPSKDDGSTEEPRFSGRECWVALPGQRLECGVLEVPLARGSRVRVQLAVLRVLARQEVGAPPLLFLGGGPGQPVIGRLAGPLTGVLSLARQRDLVFVDPRGTGFSKPSLECKKGRSLTESLKSCHDEHSVEFDPSEFTTSANARDLEALRRALSYERWDVFGTSYGTRLALTLLRDAPGSVRVAVLDSPVPLQVDLVAQLGQNAYRALEAVFEACRSQSHCARAFPDLSKYLVDVVRSLDAAPARVPRGWLDPDRFVRVLFGLLYTPEAAAYVPQLLYQAAQGDYQLFSRFEAGLRGDDFSLGVHLSVQCAEEVPFTTEAAVIRADADVPAELRTILSGKSYLEDCSLWPVRQAPSVENEPVRASEPAFILSGALDPVTPPQYAASLHGDLSASRLVVARGASHAIGLTPCGLELVEAFLRAPQDPLNLQCLSPEAAQLPAQGHLEVGTSVVFRTELPTEQELLAAIASM